MPPISTNSHNASSYIHYGNRTRRNPALMGQKHFILRKDKISTISYKHVHIPPQSLADPSSCRLNSLQLHDHTPASIYQNVSAIVCDPTCHIPSYLLHHPHESLEYISYRGSDSIPEEYYHGSEYGNKYDQK